MASTSNLYRNHSFINFANHETNKEPENFLFNYCCSQTGLRYTGYYANSGVNSFDSLAIASNYELSSVVNTAHNGHSHSPHLIFH